MRIVFITILSLIPLISSAQKYINPEGKYQIVHEAPVKYNEDGDILSRTGSIQVKVLSRNKVVVLVYGIKSAPSYNSGQLIDTVQYINNTAVCSYEGSDECKIILRFLKKSVNVKQEGMDHQCGFGAGVYVDGTYTKTKKRLIEFVNQQTGEVITK